MLALNINLIQFKHKTLVDFNVHFVKYGLHRNRMYEKKANFGGLLRVII